MDKFWINKEKKILVNGLILLFILIVAYVLFPYLFKQQTAVQSAVYSKQACLNNECFNVEIADSYYERMKGLMDREKLDENNGLLFIFPEENTWGFWMKNTLIPLDIIWVDENMKIVHIKENAHPCEEIPCPIYLPKTKAKYVLEINSGLVSELNITESSTFKLNFIPSNP